MLSAVCSGCNTEITGQVMSAYERLYHPACFVCAQCLQPIHAGETFALRGNDLYCKKDYDRVLAAGSMSPLVGSDRDKKRTRTAISEEQTAILRRFFTTNPTPDQAQRVQLARTTGLTPRVVQVWFQNRRAKLKKTESLTHPSDSSINLNLARSAPVSPQQQRVQTSADPFSQPQHRVAPQGTLSPNHLLHTDMERGLHRGQSMPNLVLPDDATSMPCADLRDGAWLDPPMAPAPTSSTDHLQATVKAEQVPLLLQPIGLKRCTSTPQLPGPPPGPIYSGSVDSPKIRRGSNLKLRPSPYNRLVEMDAFGSMPSSPGMSPMLHSISLMDLGGPATSDFDFDRLTTELLQECLGHNMQ